MGAEAVVKSCINFVKQLLYKKCKGKSLALLKMNCVFSFLCKISKALCTFQ